VRRLPYPVVCALVGIVAGSVPRLVHGPIHEKFDVLYIKGVIAVWAWYTARTTIGFLVGITWWPERWWLRGPLCGLVMILPLDFISLATPGCGPPCMAANTTSAVLVGTAVAGIAFWMTGRHRA
jgi:hypothetical protein